jgi:recombination protein RecA
MPNNNIEIRDDSYTEDIMRKVKKKKFHIYYGNDPRLNVAKIPFDIPQLDKILGGGLPLGRTTLVVGNFGAGKTFFGQLSIANFQKNNLTTAYVDVERRFDPEWFTHSNIDVSKLFVAQPDSGENALDICEFLVKEKFGLVVLDSVAALSPVAELEGQMEDSTVAALARLLNKGLRKITNENVASEDLSYKGTAFLVINQIRSGIGPFTTYSLPGGQGQQYFTSILLRVMRGAYIEQDGKKIGFNMKFHTDKNNLAEWPQECSLPFLFTGKIDTVGGLVELALDVGIIKQAGPYYYLPWEEDKKIQGKQGLIEHIKADSKLFDEIKERIYQSEQTQLE